MISALYLAKGVKLNHRGAIAIVRWFDNEKTTIGIWIVVLLSCETDGIWMCARLRGALPHAVLKDPFGQAIPAAQVLGLYQ